ncbi:MAG: choice-of-anchor Q domain-containing protein [Planctomycetota bacterium]
MKLSTQMVYYIQPTDDYDTAFETAVLQADYDLFGGANEEILWKIFSMRKIYGTHGPYPWTTSFIRSDSRPYTDNEDDHKQHTIPGATALRVTFDAYTKTYAPASSGYYDDYIYVRDLNDQDIAGSPFKGRELQNRTVEVPGDTVKVWLWSYPGNNRTSKGYLVTNICAVDPLNQAPVAQADVSATEGMEPLVVTFDTSPSHDPDGSIICRTLDPGDGSKLVQLDTNTGVEHVYDRNGVGPLTGTTVFNATLTVTDNKGETNTVIIPITVHPWVALHVPGDHGTIQEAIDAAVARQEVLVEPGVYQENLDFHGKQIRVAAVQGPAETILDGGGLASVVTFQSGEGADAVLEGFTITNGLGSANSGASMGGGILCRNGSSPTIAGNVIRGNLAECGAGICADGASPVLRNNLIERNTAQGDGGGLACLNAAAPTLVYGTVSLNQAGGNGGGLCSDGTSSPEVLNSILWGDTATTGPEIQTASGTILVASSDVQGGYAGTGNINQDPLFAAASSGDFHLAWPSPCVDAGMATSLPGPRVDLDDNPRLFDGDADGTAVPDMGCFEYLTMGVPAQYATIQGAIDSALNECTVLVGPGTYLENLDFKGKRITVKSTDGPLTTVIDGHGAGSVAVFTSCEQNRTTLEGFTLTNGSGTLLTNGEWQVRGGAIYIDGACPTIRNNVITSNTATTNGGAIACVGAGNAYIFDNSISNNAASIRAGGIYCWQSSPRIEGNFLSGNRAEAGGGICVLSGEPEILNNTFSHNIADLSGGGLYASGTFEVANCVFDGNTAVFYGGGIQQDGGTLRVTNCTLFDNSATNSGGGLYSLDPNTLVTNCILWGNTALNGPQIWSTPTVTWCDVEGGFTGLGNLALDPLFVNAPAGDFHLTRRSPCIEAGDSLAPFLPDFDLDGNPRVLLGWLPCPRTHTATVDMGAHEFLARLPRVR